MFFKPPNNISFLAKLTVFEKTMWMCVENEGGKGGHTRRNNTSQYQCNEKFLY